ncbi:MAG TPA: D-alanyl-D-alanine carboxypeptidase family protein [Actinomycetota bacterium]|nr:D-alanyl-D-alanine carboxypeptidase family protein [Actinomycetota bacterium]
MPNRRVRAVAPGVAVLLALSIALAPAANGRPSPPPPTPVPPSGSPSPYPSVLHTPRPGDHPPKLRAAAAVLADLDTGQVLFRAHPAARRPIASLTKILTAWLVLKRADLGDRVTVSARAAGESGSVLGLDRGERVSVRDLLYGLLLQSSNDAAVALAEHVGGSVEHFVTMMNREAGRLGLARTKVQSPHGLDDRGYSTADDLARLTRAASGDPAFDVIVATRRRTIPAPKGPDRRIQNRNALLWLYPGAIGVKTGYTGAAGHCLVATAERAGRRLVAVVLGEPDEAFSDGAALLNYGFTAFQQATLIRAGEEIGPVDVRGRPVPAAAGETLSALVPRTQLSSVRRRLVPAKGLRAPIRAGQRVGTVVLTAGNQVVGRVKAVAARSLGPPAFWELPPEDLAAAGRGAQAFVIVLRSLQAAFL